MRYIFIIGAIAWFSTAITTKSGPYNIFINLKTWVSSLIGPDNSPLECPFCIGPYIAILVLLIELILPEFNTFFGIVGLAATIRGMSNEF